MDVKELATEVEKSEAVGMEWAFGNNSRFSEWLSSHVVDKGEVMPLVKGRKPDAVSRLDKDPVCTSWYVLDGGTIIGVYNMGSKEPGPDDTWAYVIPQSVSKIPKVKGYRVPVIPS